MYSYKYVLFFILSLFMLISCEDAALTPREYMTWVQNPENGLKSTRQLNSFQFELQYKPAAYVALLEFRNEQYDNKDFEMMKNSFSNLQYYTFKITTTENNDLMKTNIGNIQAYSQRVQYVSSQMQQDFKLKVGENEYPCTLYLFEPNYGVAPYNNILLGFNVGNASSKIMQDQTLIWKDNVFGVGIIKMTINADDINKANNIRINV